MIYEILNINEVNIEEISNMVSAKRLEKASKYKNESDRVRSIAVEYLLNKLILQNNPEAAVPVELSYDEHGKPHTEGLEISLSHSGDYVAAIISDLPCGIDIERHSKRRDYEKIAKRICTEEELSHISSMKDFYSYWTLKESLLKAVGLGLAFDMKKAEMIAKVNDEENKGEHREENKEEKTEEIEKNQSYYTLIDDNKYEGYVLPAPENYSLSYVELINH